MFVRYPEYCSACERQKKRFSVEYPKLNPSPPKGLAVRLRAIVCKKVHNYWLLSEDEENWFYLPQGTAWVMRLKNLTGFVVIITILFSYVPVFSMDQCPEGNHMGNVKMDCGYSFYCPMIVNKNILGTYRLPLNGRLVPGRLLLVLDELIRVIFHPPKIWDPHVLRDEGKEII
jgi:hypothetical protein